LETAEQINEELKERNLMVLFAKNANFLSIDFHFFAKRRKLVEKMIHQKKKGVTERPRSLNPGKAIATASCLYLRAQ